MSDTPKRPRAKKIKVAIGPFQTITTYFERGKDREIEIVRITPHLITYRLKGQPEEYNIGHAVAFQKAVSITAGMDTGARTGRMKRGEAQL